MYCGESHMHLDTWTGMKCRLKTTLKTRPMALKQTATEERTREEYQILSTIWENFFFFFHTVFCFLGFPCKRKTVYLIGSALCYSSWLLFSIITFYSATFTKISSKTRLANYKETIVAGKVPKDVNSQVPYYTWKE